MVSGSKTFAWSGRGSDRFGRNVLIMRDIPTGRPPSHYHGRHLLNRGIMSLLLLLHWPCKGLQWMLEHCTSSSTGLGGMELSRCKGRIKEFVTLEKKFIRRWAGERGGGVRYPQFWCRLPQTRGRNFSQRPKYVLEICLFNCIDAMGMTKILPLPS